MPRMHDPKKPWISLCPNSSVTRAWQGLQQVNWCEEVTFIKTEILPLHIYLKKLWEYLTLTHTHTHSFFSQVEDVQAPGTHWSWMRLMGCLGMRTEEEFRRWLHSLKGLRFPSLPCVMTGTIPRSDLWPTTALTSGFTSPGLNRLG